MVELLATAATIGLGVLAVVGVVIAASRASRRWKEAMRGTAEHFGIAFEPGTWLKKGYAEGRVGDFDLKIDSYTVSTGKSSQTFTRIVLQTDLPDSLTLKREGLFKGLRKVITGDDVQVGLDSFDDRFLLEGTGELDLLSRMGVRTRQAMWHAIGEHKAKVKNGTIELVKSGLVRDAAKLTRLTQSVLELAGALDANSGHPAAALLDLSQNDPDLPFRRRCLEALTRHIPRADQTKEALSAARTDSDPGMRFIAARFDGDLDAIRQLVDQQVLPEELRTQAVALLGPRYGGGLSLAAEGEAGQLSLQAQGVVGGLSSAADRVSEDTEEAAEDRDRAARAARRRSRE